MSTTGKNPPTTLGTPSISNSPTTSVSAQAARHLTALMLDRIAVDASGLSDIDGPTGAYRVDLRRGPDYRQLQRRHKVDVSTNISNQPFFP
ncbi:hypothetical protein, partial [Xanthomonas perforans]|uniref:hypothetical protein n=1 Tax=Xanthomonas perforans TaxID=442694 RepID=UPI001F2C2E87